MSFEKRITLEAVRNFPFSSIGVSYSPINPPFSAAISLVSFFNATDITLFFSFDGVTDHLLLPPQNNITLSTSQFSSSEEKAEFPLGTTIFVKEFSGAGSLGVAIINTAYLS